MNAIKNAAAKKPKKKIERPEVMTEFRSTIFLKPGFDTAGPISRVHRDTGPTQRVPHQRSNVTGPPPQVKQQQQQQPFICTHTTYKIITINIVKLVESTTCPK